MMSAAQQLIVYSPNQIIALIIISIQSSKEKKARENPYSCEPSIVWPFSALGNPHGITAQA
jgi:hypothetical protein